MGQQANANVSAKVQPEIIRARYASLKLEQPELRARNAAEILGISEGELVASAIGEGVIRLIDDLEPILGEAAMLGEVMALTRNEHCVHERKGVYENPGFHKHGPMKQGLFVNPDIDLRLFLNHWHFSFAVAEDTKSGPRRSLQFFDKAGDAVHKIYITGKSDAPAYEALVDRHRHPEQVPGIAVEAYDQPEPLRPDEQIDWPGFRTTWEGLKDTHDFFPMLRKFKVGREQALRGIGRDFAYEVDNSASRLMLEMARDRECEIMVFVGNRGCIQIHSGTVRKLVEHGSWYNVLDPMFNLHLNEDSIVRTWVTRKPTVDGHVTALEVFDAKGDLIVTFFGKRKPGIPELTLWREIIDAIAPKEVSNVA